jgi:hypothetical protein
MGKLDGREIESRNVVDGSFLRNITFKCVPNLHLNLADNYLLVPFFRDLSIQSKRVSMFSSDRDSISPSIWIEGCLRPQMVDNEFLFS